MHFIHLTNQPQRPPLLLLAWLVDWVGWLGGCESDCTNAQRVHGVVIIIIIIIIIITLIIIIIMIMMMIIIITLI